MSATLSPTGLRPVGRVGNGPYDGSTSSYPLTTNNTVAMAVGDPVALVAGSIVPLTANPAAGTLSANTPIGVVLGFSYTDAVNQRSFVCSQILASNAITNLGYTNVLVLVADDPDARFEVQAGGTIPAVDLGAGISLTNFNTPDLLSRTSRVRADQTTVTESGTTSPLKIVKFSPNMDNAAGDAFTKLIVVWNANTHYLRLAGTH